MDNHPYYYNNTEEKPSDVDNNSTNTEAPIIPSILDEKYKTPPHKPSFKDEDKDSYDEHVKRNNKTGSIYYNNIYPEEDDYNFKPNEDEKHTVSPLATKELMQINNDVTNLILYFNNGSIASQFNTFNRRQTS